jgi:hypothetical protein
MSVREVFIDWLTGSRYVRSLESRIVEQRQDWTERLAEKDERIRELRTEVAGLKLECDRMRVVIAPRFAGVRKPPVVPEFTGALDWQAELQEMLKADGLIEKETHGIPESGRKAVHESPSDAGA